MSNPENVRNQNLDIASDIEVTSFFIQHIKYPCEDLAGNNIRNFYIREARRILPSFTNEEAKSLLEDIIARYSD